MKYEKGSGGNRAGQEWAESLYIVLRSLGLSFTLEAI